jgi:magnesium chelatase family protein
VEVPRLPEADLLATTGGEGSPPIRERVLAARRVQQERFGHGAGSAGVPPASVRRIDGVRVYANGAMGPRQIKKHCVVDETARDLLKAAIRQLGLSARAYDRILRLSRTIADLAGSEAIAAGHVAEAIQYRTLDRKLWE